MAGISLASGFDLNSPVPLDSRTQVANITARNAISSGNRYQGLMVYVVDEAKHYTLKNGITNSNWAEVGGAVTRHREEFVATEGQRVFTLAHPYDQLQNRIDVEVGGVPQSSPANFAESSSTTITLSEGIPAGIVVVVIYFSEAQPLSNDLGTTVDNLTIQLATVLAEVSNDIDGGIFSDTTTGIEIDGGDFT